MSFRPPKKTVFHPIRCQYKKLSRVTPGRWCAFTEAQVVVLVSQHEPRPCRGVFGRMPERGGTRGHRGNRVVHGSTAGSGRGSSGLRET